MKRAHGPRQGTRKLLRKRRRERGKLTVSRVLQSFKLGERVRISPEPSVTKGMPFKRFAGRIGVVEEKRGSAYLVGIKDGKRKKQVICLPVHLKKV